MLESSHLLRGQDSRLCERRSPRRQATNHFAVLLAVIILVGAGAYVCVKREVQASAKFLIRGRPALSIGVALVAGGVSTVMIPALCGMLGLFKDLVGALLLSFAIIAATLAYVAAVALAEKRRQSSVRPPMIPDGTQTH